MTKFLIHAKFNFIEIIKLSILFMNGLTFSSMRVGKRYILTNYGEKLEFTLLEVLPRNDYLIKDLFSMEEYLVSEIIQFGRGEDFELREIN